MCQGRTELRVIGMEPGGRFVPREYAHSAASEIQRGQRGDRPQACAIGE